MQADNRSKELLAGVCCRLLIAAASAKVPGLHAIGFRHATTLNKPRIHGVACSPHQKELSHESSGEL